MSVTVIIPSRNERFLNQTVQDVLVNATGAVEIIVITDGYEAESRIKDLRVRYLQLDPSEGMQKRHGINRAVDVALGDYVMALDAHCKVGVGFDEILSRSCDSNTVVIPRRERLDAENWRVIDDGRPPVDYEYPMWQDFKKGRLRSYKWNDRTIEREAITIDPTMGFQGSCYFLRKDYFRHLGLMQIEGYGGFAQESEEINCKVWRDGGQVLTNKLTWYAHLHKGKQYGRMYHLDWDEVERSILYSYNKFAKENQDAFIKWVEAFMPIPNWPDNWKEYLP